MTAYSADHSALAIDIIAGTLDASTLPGLVGTPFQTPGWLSAWRETYRPDPADCFLAVVGTAGGRTILALPLVRERRGSLDVLTLPDCGVSDYLAPLVGVDFGLDRTAFLRIWRRVVRMLPPADLLAIEKAPTAIGGHPNPLAMLGSVVASPLRRHPLPLGDDFAALRDARFDGSCMRSLERKRRKLERKGDLRFSVATAADADADAMLDQVLAWRELRFADRNDPAKLARDRAFYHRLFRDTDLARLFRLTLDGRLIAGCYGTVVGGAVQLLGVAYDEAWKNWSPGMLVMLDAIAWAVDGGIGEFDFTIGDESYKRDFGVLDEGLFEVYEPLSLRGRSYVAKVRAKRLVRGLIRRAGLQATAARLRQGFGGSPDDGRAASHGGAVTAALAD